MEIHRRSHAQSESLDDLHDVSLSSASHSELPISTAESRRKKSDAYRYPLRAPPKESGRLDTLVFVLLWAISLAMRIYKVDHPSQVVFDEVHFGKFSAHYLNREYFFDVHPPLAKLILAFGSKLAGFDGDFDFENIGDDYLAPGVPYVKMRLVPVLIGSFIPPLVYLISREARYPRLVSLLSTIFVLFDNAHVTQSRFILLDAPMLLFMLLSIYSYIRFYRYRYSEFTRPWWTWLALTGAFMSLTTSCKVNGILIFAPIGIAVLADLWKLLDYKRGLSISEVAAHFAARALCLIILPFLLYLVWFYVHFTILTQTGPGDEFHSPAFQETLVGNPLTLNSQEIHYYDTIVIQHRQTNAFLHSHTDRYPLHYPDGRVSTAGQQVTAYRFNDTNNHWIVEPTKELPETGRGRLVRHEDIITLRHVATNTTLITHDVASPLMPTNTEFTTYNQSDIPPIDDEEAYRPYRRNLLDSRFELRIDDAHSGQQWKSKVSHFRLIHSGTGVAMWTHQEPLLPEWGHKQQEVNGNKKIAEKSTLWVVDEIIKSGGSPVYRQSVELQPERRVRKMSFFKKYWETQLLMLQHNAGLTDSHPYASSPIGWPITLSGISYWTGNDTNREQIYLIGNIFCFWIPGMAFSILLGIFVADQLAKRRGLDPLPDPIANRLYNTPGFFFVGFLTHYLPYFTMGRQLFLHHYLPAQLYLALLSGPVIHFVFSDTVNAPASIEGPTRLRRRPALVAAVPYSLIITTAVLAVLTAGFFVFLSPVTYGYPGLTAEQVNARRVLSSWTMHFAK